jgi:hypothetical protein
MGTGGSFPGVKRPGREANHSPATSAEVKKNVDLYIHYPIRLHGVVLNQLSTGTTLPFTTTTTTNSSSSFDRLGPLACSHSEIL